MGHDYNDDKEERQRQRATEAGWDKVNKLTGKPLTGKDVFIPFSAPEFNQTEKLVQERGSVYGHPLDDFGRAAKLKAVVADIKDPELRHAAEMVCVKLARLCNTPEHLDSWDDIAGYGKTGRMVIEERARRAAVKP